MKHAAAFLTMTVSLLVLSTTAFGKSGLSDYAGRYTNGKDFAVYFEITKYGLTIRPVLWTATQLLRPTGANSFEVVDRTSRGADFVRDAGGKVVGVKIRGMDGEGLELRKSFAPLLPVELFLDGRTVAAAAQLKNRAEQGLSDALDIAEKIFTRLPTKRRFVVRFLTTLEGEFRNNSRYYSLLGYTLVAAGDRLSAKRRFLTAYKLDPNNNEAISGLARLRALPIDYKATERPWPMPFSLSDVFKRPTAAEIRSVENEWNDRDLLPANVAEVKRGELLIDGWKANVKIISYLIHGTRNYGAVIIPKNAAAGCCPVIVNAKGVSPTYFPLELEKIESIRTMEDLKNRFVYVVPSFRGEKMIYDGITYSSDGDRRDALDGATDDTISFLTAALKLTPEADRSRICAFGHSRGGTVAMLTGIRDKRVDCVVNVAGPTDWFYAMGTEGWTEQELWQEGVRIHATPSETGGQNLERFMGRAFDGKATLADVRLNMIASSPLYFAKRLPLSQHHYGIEDVSVPARNGRQLEQTLKRRPANHFSIYFYPGQGHDTDRIKEPRLAKAFIANALGVR